MFDGFSKFRIVFGMLHFEKLSIIIAKNEEKPCSTYLFSPFLTDLPKPEFRVPDSITTVIMPIILLAVEPETDRANYQSKLHKI